MKAIITRYALTSGVEIVSGEISNVTPTMFCESRESRHMCRNFHGNDWHTSKESAFDQVSSMTARRRKALERQLAELDTRRDEAMKAIELYES